MNIYRSNGELLVSSASKASKTRFDGKREIEDIDISSCDLSQAALENLAFVGGTMENVRLFEASLKNVVFEGMWGCDVVLSNSFIEDTEFYDVVAFGAVFLRANLKNVKFYGSNLSDTDFSNATFVKVVFDQDNIHHKTNLSGANLTNVDLANTAFKGATYDDFTLFPEGFDPLACDGLLKL